MPLRIALCITELEIGGAERSPWRWPAARSGGGCAAGRFSAASGGQGQWLADEPAAAEIPAEYLDARTARDLPRTVERLTQRFRQFRPDVVQTFLFHANVVGALGCRRAGVRHVAGGIRVAEQRRWHRWVARHAVRWTDCQVCVSRAVAEFSARVTGIDAARLCVIPNGVDVARSNRRCRPIWVSSGVRPGQRVFCCIGRLDRQKGIDWLLDLLPPVFCPAIESRSARRGHRARGRDARAGRHGGWALRAGWRSRAYGPKFPRFWRRARPWCFLAVGGNAQRPA